MSASLRPLQLRLLLPVGLCMALAPVHIGTSVADGSVRTLRATSVSGKASFFDLRGVHPRSIVSARLFRGRRTWVVDVRSLRAATRRSGRVRVSAIPRRAGSPVLAFPIRRLDAERAKSRRPRKARSRKAGRRTIVLAAHHRRGKHKLQVVTDTTAPDTNITAGPQEGETLATGEATFSFTGADDIGVTGFECSLDGGAYSACTSPSTHAGLSEGTHTFRVRARNAAGNVDGTPASRTFDVALSAPSTALTQPSSSTDSTSSSDATSPIQAPTSVLFFDDFSQANGPNNLITNEYASYNPSETGIVRSPHWENRRGSTFFREGRAWSGVPDGRYADKHSQSSNDSAWTRLRTHRSDFANVTVEYDFMIPYLTSTSTSPPVDWDGSQMWLRYQTEEHLYAISFFDRSGKTHIKKKCPGGPSNGGTYYMLAGTPNAIPFGAWQHVRGSVQNNPDGSVTIQAYQEGRLILQAIDTNVGCPAIRAAGRVGMRADNAEWFMDNFRISAP